MPCSGRERMVRTALPSGTGRGAGISLKLAVPILCPARVNARGGIVPLPIPKAEALRVKDGQGELSSPERPDRSHGEGAFSRAGVHLSVTGPPSLEIGESGPWGVNVEWGDSSGSGRARGAQKGPRAWAQPHTLEPGANPENWRCWARSGCRRGFFPRFVSGRKKQWLMLKELPRAVGIARSLLGRKALGALPGGAGACCLRYCV